MPVKLPPGLAQLCTSWTSSGSPLKPNTTGFVVLSDRRPKTVNSCATITSGSDARSSRPTASTLSSPVAQKTPIVRLRPSLQPNSAKPARSNSK